MTDPISGGIGKASQQMVQELQKQMQELQQTQSKEVNFQDMVSQTQQTNPAQDPTKVQEAQKPTEVAKATDVLKQVEGNPVDGLGSVRPVEQSQSGKGIKKLLGQIVEGQNKLDDIIKMATSGKKYSNQDLLAIQASVYKFSQELDLTSKVVEKATSGVKQTMSTQV